MRNLRKLENTNELNFATNEAWGILPVTVIDSARLMTDGLGAIIMQRYANEEAVTRTLEYGPAMFWSEVRQTLWTPGAVSGRLLRAVGVYVNDRGTSLLYDVRPDFAAQHDGPNVPAPYFVSEYVVE